MCRDYDRRRQDIRKHTDATGERDLNGIDYLKVDESQTTLTVYFLGPVAESVKANNIRIDGGVRIRNIKVVNLHRCDPKDPRVDGCLQIQVDRPGDFSTYTLRLVNSDARGRPGDEPLTGFDPRYAQLDFSFKASCPSDLDCAPRDICPPASLNEPEINYLAKDYASFRQLILDRLSQIMPDWKERHVPDLGIALVELLAYVGDYLSYYQDAVATEAYLGTARLRISVRRHVKLVDYQLSEGCNARAWVCVEVDDGHSPGNFEDVYFISGSDQLFAPVLSSEDLRNVPFSAYEVFEPVIEKPNQPLQFYPAHNSIPFYTWNDRECCLPRGATSATLKDDWVVEPTKPPVPVGDASDSGYLSPQQIITAAPSGAKKLVRAREKAKPERGKTRYQEPELANNEQAPPRSRLLHFVAGDVLIFEEQKGPITGVKADADPAHRHVVRLTKVEPRVDPLYDQPILEIEWTVEDALPFALCISAIGRAPDCVYLENISVAHGNVLLVDHGRRVGSTGTEAPESWTVPAETKHDAGCWAEKDPRETVLRAGKFTPRLRLAPLTYRAPFPRPPAVAHQQAILLSQLMRVVRGRVEQLWRAARDGRLLTAEEIAEIRTIFGPEAMGADIKRREPSSPEEQAKQLERLLEHEERLLARKARRVEGLAGRARAGYVLGATDEIELSQMFGSQVVENAGVRGKKTLGPASQALTQDAREALPCVRLHEQNQDGPSSDEPTTLDWMPQTDLLESDGEARDFVVEIDNDGRAHMRFGDGDRGRAPIPNTILTATYRAGNGARGNVGAGAISHFVFRQHTTGVNLRVRNPLPARGGVDPEPLAQAKLFAPMTFRRQLERAVTRDDYALLAHQSDPAHIQQASASPLHWTGSWYEVQVAIDPFDKEDLDRDLREGVEGYLYRYRRIGHDLRVLPAKYVPLDIELTVCVLEHYLRADVEAALLDLFSNRALPDGRLGFFHPDNLSFGDGVYLSKIVAAAQGVTGVESTRVTRLQRLFEAPNQEIEKGVLPMGAGEVARLDNDRSFPEQGKLMLKIGGGR
jgi:predicted phage baseplate assembly protein